MAQIRRVRSSEALPLALTVEMGSRNRDFEAYGKTLKYRKDLLLSCDINKVKTDASKIAKALVCGRIVGSDSQNPTSSCRRRYYCRCPSYCNTCNAISIDYRSQRTANRAERHSDADQYSFVFTTTQPFNSEGELRHAVQAYNGFIKLKGAIRAYNVQRPRDGDLASQRIHEYGMGLHFNPTKDNPSLLWSHVHLFAAIGPEAQVGKFGSRGLASKLAAAFDSQLDDPGVHRVKLQGEISSRVTSEPTSSGKRMNTTVQHLKNAIAYAMKLNPSGDSPETTMQRERLCSRLQSEHSITERQLSCMSRRGRGVIDNAPQRSLPNEYPGRAESSVTYVFPFDGGLPYRVRGEDYDQAKKQLSKQAREIASRHVASLEAGN